MEERESTSTKVRELPLVWRTKLFEYLTRNTGIDFDKSLFVVFGFGNFSLERLKSPPDPPPFHNGVTPYKKGFVLSHQTSTQPPSNLP
jgi:hypothetical protein